MIPKSLQGHVLLLRGALLVTLVACDRSPPTACTLIGCFDGFTVTINGAPPTTLVSVVANPPSKTLTCVAATSGSCAVYFEDGTPSSVTLQVSWNSQTKTVTVQPTYQIDQPNGPDCEPTCHWAMITLNV